MVVAFAGKILYFEMGNRVRYLPMNTAEEARRALGMAARMRRTLLGMSQEDVGKASGLNPANLSRIETGAADATVTTQCRLAAGLGWTVFQLWAEAEMVAAKLAERSSREGGAT